MTSIYFDTTETGSFGTVLTDQMAAIAVKYSCPNTTNCTDNTLANAQWGEGTITANSLYTNDDYLPEGDSIINWSQGTYPISGYSTYAPELKGYGTYQAMSTDSVNNLNTATTAAGVLNYYNAERMSVSYYTNNQTNLALLQFGLDYDVSQFVSNMAYHIDNWLLHGSMTTLTQD